SEKHVIPSSTLVALLSVFIVITAPLFLLAVDWGRWISIHAVLTTVTCALLLSDQSTARAVRLHPVSLAGAYLFAGMLVLSSTLLWSVNYCCAGEYLNALGPVQHLRDQLRQAGI